MAETRHANKDRGCLKALVYFMAITFVIHLMFSNLRNIETMVTSRHQHHESLRQLAKAEYGNKLLSVPAFFIFGDSTVDSGNNNFLLTFAKANIPPYGRDFLSHSATGRFSNGRISVDYLASYMGLPLVPAVLGVPGTIGLEGINYASAGAGIFFQTGSDLGQHISLNEQLGLFSNTEARMVLHLGKSTAYERISKSIFYFSIGNNDFIHYYLRNVSGILGKQNSLEFSKTLVEKLSTDLKIAFVGIGPLGCAPNMLYQYNSSSGDCVHEINNIVKDYNSGLKSVTSALSEEFPSTKIIFCDIFDEFYDIVKNASSYGFEKASTACCGAGKYGGWASCLMPEMACSDATKYVFWDDFHPTEKVHRLTALSIWNGTSCSPMTLQKLVAS